MGVSENIVRDSVGDVGEGVVGDGVGDVEMLSSDTPKVCMLGVWVGP